MAYAHYWERVAEFDRDSFVKAVEDIRLIISRAVDMGLRVAGPTGAGVPELSKQTIAFNGSSECGHRYRDLGKPFAASDATGVEEKEPPYDAESDPWFSGPYLETRVCNGNCAAEPFVVDRKYLVRNWERKNDTGTYSCDVETHFKPYDLIVTAALIRLKERLGDAIVVSSENPENGFEDAKRLCRELFGWAARWELKSSEPAIIQ